MQSEIVEKSAAQSQGEPTQARSGRVDHRATYAVANEWGDDFDLNEFVDIVRRGRLFVISFTLLATLAGTAYALLASEWYRAEAVLAPARAGSMQGVTTQLDSLANLAGIKLNSDDRAEPLAVLKSKGFARQFLRDESLTEEVLIAKRNPIKGLHIDAGASPDIREAVDFFGRRILGVSEDRKTGIVTLSIEWRDADVAAAWANELVARLNDQMRARALNESNANIAYLRSELVATNPVALQNSIGRLLEVELQKAMIARGNREFSYRIVDDASPPLKRAWPKRSLIVLLSFAFGLVLSVAMLLFRHSFSSRPASTA